MVCQIMENNLALNKGFPCCPGLVSVSHIIYWTDTSNKSVKSWRNSHSNYEDTLSQGTEGDDRSIYGCWQYCRNSAAANGCPHPWEFGGRLQPKRGIRRNQNCSIFIYDVSNTAISGKIFANNCTLMNTKENIRLLQRKLFPIKKLWRCRSYIGHKFTSSHQQGDPVLVLL